MTFDETFGILLILLEFLTATEISMDRKFEIFM